MRGVCIHGSNRARPGFCRIIRNSVSAQGLALAFCLSGFLATAGCIGVTGKSAGSPSAGGTSVIVVTPSTINFPSVAVGVNMTQVMQITNTGTADLTVTMVTPTGPAFSVSGLSLPKTIGAGASANFSANFDPVTAGTDSGTLTIVSNASVPSITIPWSGKAIAAIAQLSANPGSLAFGNVTLQTTSQQQLVLTNSGTDDVAISSVSVTGAGFGETGGGNVNLVPGQSANVTVSFSPTTAGSVTGSVSISSNAQNSPLQVALSGTGTSQPTQHTVSLTWSPGSSSTPPVVGYYVYRGTISGGPYSRLNQSADTATSYKDSTVASGSTYYYVVTSVDSSNVQSSFSGQVSAAIPQ